MDKLKKCCVCGDTPDYYIKVDEDVICASHSCCYNYLKDMHSTNYQETEES